MTITNDDVKRVAYKLAEEIIADCGYLNKKLLSNRMENTLGIRPVVQVLPGGLLDVTSFAQRSEMLEVIANDEAMIDYRAAIRRMDADGLKNEQENVKSDPAKTAAIIGELNARKSEIYSAFVSMIRGLPADVYAQKIAEIISGGPMNAFRKSVLESKERERKESIVHKWKQDHPDIPVEPAEEEDDGEFDGDDEDEDEDHPESEEWQYDAGDANNPWYLIWSGGNNINVISMIFPSKKAGLEYLVPIIGVPVSENDNDVSWDFDVDKASNTEIAKLFTDWCFGCGAPSSPSLVRVKFGKPLVGFDLD